MQKTKVLILGATGETGGDILAGLLEDGSFEVGCLVQPSSANKPSVQALKDRGHEIVVADLSGSVDDLANALKGYDTVISTIGSGGQSTQINLVDAAAKAGIKRFVPSGFAQVCPPGGVMILRDEKEEIHQRIWYHHLPYTIIDVGVWHQFSYFRLPSGRADYVMGWTDDTLHGDLDAPAMFTDKRDIGRFVARIIKDERTLNQKIFTYSDVLSQNEIRAMLEEKSGEKLELNYLSEEETLKKQKAARDEVALHPEDFMKKAQMWGIDFIVSRYLRRDNTPEVAKYLGYLDARELYPEFKPIKLAEYIDELLTGKAKKMYLHLRPQ